jgi:hypothetical protein
MAMVIEMIWEKLHFFLIIKKIKLKKRRGFAKSLPVKHSSLIITFFFILILFFNIRFIEKLGSKLISIYFYEIILVS